MNWVEVSVKQPMPSRKRRGFPVVGLEPDEVEHGLRCNTNFGLVGCISHGSLQLILLKLHVRLLLSTNVNSPGVCMLKTIQTMFCRQKIHHGQAHASNKTKTDYTNKLDFFKLNESNKRSNTKGSKNVCPVFLFQLAE